MSSMGFIFARGGSKGISNKNLQDFDQKLLDEWDKSEIPIDQFRVRISEWWVAIDYHIITDIIVNFDAMFHIIEQYLTSSGKKTFIYLNSIFWVNIAQNIQEIYSDEFSVISASFSDIKGGFEGEGNIDANPLFINSEEGNFYFRR